MHNFATTSTQAQIPSEYRNAGEPEVQITQTGIAVSQGAIERLRRQFNDTGSAPLPRLFPASVLDPVLKLLESSRFEIVNEVTRESGRIFGTTLKMPFTEPTLTTLHFILNHKDLFRIVEEVTGCPKIGNFTCRLHRTRAGADEHIDWHDDTIDGRVVGLNINLSTEPYSGGVLQIRDGQKIVRSEAGRFPAGDGCLFRIGGGWQHRLTPVESGQRTVAVGWFRTEPDWHELTAARVRASRLTRSDAGIDTARP
jgi:hypothetical protein